MRRAAASECERVSRTVFSKPLGFLLVRRDHGGAGFHASRQWLAIGIEQSLDALLSGARDQLRVKIGGHARRQTAAQHQPGGVGQLRFHRAFDAGQFAAIQAGSELVELHRQAVAVHDGEIQPDIVADREPWRPESRNPACSVRNEAPRSPPAGKMARVLPPKE